jgi:hypothetical protein
VTRAARRFFPFLLYLALTFTAISLAVRFVAGPFHAFFVSVNSPVNAAAAAALAFLLLTIWKAGKPAPIIRTHASLVGMVVLVLITAAAFWPNLGAPFVYDDYTHIAQTSHVTWRILLDAFRPVIGGHGLFFRPIAFISYWLDYHWAGNTAARWHAWSLAAHAANVCLVYLLIVRLGMRRGAAICAALLFALHGSRAETVAWSDARSDLLATFFCLAALLAGLRYCRGGRQPALILMLLSAALGMCTKESAFCLPLLPITLLPFLDRSARRRVWFTAALLGLTSVILFAYRWHALGGLGGYADRSGASAVWDSRPLHTGEALFFRQWGFLFFPVNWSVPLEWWMRVAAILFIAAMVICAPRLHASRNRLLAGLAFLLAADLPVQHLLMFQPDFAGARVLYLPVAGLAIFWGALLEGVAQPKLKWAMAAALLFFNSAALEHNLAPWRTVPLRAAAVCRTFGAQIANDSQPAVIRGLPDREDGVYFLDNGFPECVEMNSGQPMGRVYVVGRSGGDPPAHARQFVWDPRAGGLNEQP